MHMKITVKCTQLMPFVELNFFILCGIISYLLKIYISLELGEYTCRQCMSHLSCSPFPMTQREWLTGKHGPRQVTSLLYVIYPVVVPSHYAEERELYGHMTTKKAKKRMYIMICYKIY